MLDEAVRKILLEYLSDVRALPNEAAKRTRFASLLSALFPGAERRIKFAAGVERVVRIDTGEGKKVGRIDAYFGNAVIEFENSLKATGDEAERQLKEYTSGLWNKEGRDRPLICIASDGLIWRTYRPRLKSDAGRSTRPRDVELEEVEGRLEMRTADQLRAEGCREFAKWMARAEKTWAEKRTGKADKQSVYQRLDYSRELTHQTMRPRHLVLYNAAGSNLSATPVDRRDLSLPFIVDHKLYWAICKTRIEADYLAAILNSAVVNEKIKPFQSRGLLGERDI